MSDTLNIPAWLREIATWFRSCEFANCDQQAADCERAATEVEALLQMEAHVLSVKPGDVIVFRCPQPLHQEQKRRARIVLEQLFPNSEILLLDGGQDIAIVRPTGRWWQFWKRNGAG